MWKHRNDTLFNNQQNGLSYKRRKAILRAVQTQLKIGFHHIQNKDRQSICSEYDKLKKWTTQMLEAWLKNVNILRERTLHLDADDNMHTLRDTNDDLYIERSEN